MAGTAASPSEVAVGKDVFAVCGKCGEVWHAIVSMTAARITKVQCKRCLKSHRYKVPDGDTRVDGPAPARRTVGGRSRVAAGQSAGAPAIAGDLSRPVRNYAMSETFTPGDRIDHPKFGHGVVEATPSEGKILVHFPTGRRTLAHARPRA